MALTLAEAQVTMQDPLLQTTYDEFRRASFLLDQLTFDDAVSPGTGGSTLTYGYTRLKEPSVAQTRAINSEYTATKAIREKASTELKIFGGAFEIDRVIQDNSGQLNEAAFQMEQQIKAATNYFHYQVINGDATSNTLEFDGLDTILTGTSTELGVNKVTDLTTITDDNKFMLLEELDNFLSELDGKPSMLMGNTKLINRIKAIARLAGYKTESEDAFGRKVDAYDGIALVDMGLFYNGTTKTTQDVVKGGLTRTVDGTSTTGLTDLFAISLGLDGFHGVSPKGGAGIRSYLPNFNTPGAVKKGEVEMVAGVALKQTRKAGVLRNIKIA